MRASERAPGEPRIYTAGEKAWMTSVYRADKGVPVGEAVQREFIEIRDRYKLPYTFPFE